MKILSAQQIADTDIATVVKEQISSEVLMERAGKKLFEWLLPRLDKFDGRILILCGPGNNGGDGLVLGRILFHSGKNVRIYVVSPQSKQSTDFLKNERKLLDINFPLIPIENEEELPEINSNDLIIDAIFGIGLNRKPEGIFFHVIQHINESSAYVISVDIPSGLYSEKPIENKEAVVKSDKVLSFQFPKMSFFLPDSAEFVSSFEILDISLDKEFYETLEPLAQTISVNEAKLLLRNRKKFSHKGTFGHVAVVGGSYGKIGSIVLSSKAALRVGAGMVTAFVPKCGYDVLQISVPEAMVVSDKDEKELTDVNPGADFKTIIIGMGMGTSEKSMDNFEHILRSTTSPMVIDADGLNCLAQKKNLLPLVPHNSVLTPHPKELERIIGKWKDDFEKIEKTKALSKKHDLIIIIKGAYSMIILRDSVYINTTGNPGMATAGSGDTLSGIIGGIMAQSYDALTAAVLGVFLHGLAGDIAAAQLGEYSLVAGDIISHLPQAFRRLEES